MRKAHKAEIEVMSYGGGLSLPMIVFPESPKHAFQSLHLHANVHLVWTPTLDLGSVGAGLEVILEVC